MASGTRGQVDLQHSKHLNTVSSMLLCFYFFFAILFKTVKNPQETIIIYLHVHRLQKRPIPPLVRVRSWSPLSDDGGGDGDALW